jgi:endogenous inhibitor of DNA gyrase (YacG/DUF329 family)
MERFKDENKYLGHFGDKIEVKCPKCDSKAIVKRSFESERYYDDKRSLECSTCYFSQKEVVIKLLNEKPEKIKIKCPICSQTKEFLPKIIKVPQSFKTNSNLETEEWFGTELWYQVQFDKAIFWALNLEHINYLERYIRANLRERSTLYSSTLVARLPKFVKEAKNREKLLKIIQKWKK